MTDLPGDQKFDLITAFDAIHDQKAPDAVLRSANGALAPRGKFLMIEYKFSSRVEDNVTNPFAPMFYGISLMHCMPVSLAVGGQGLGIVSFEDTTAIFKTNIFPQALRRYAHLIDLDKPFVLRGRVTDDHGSVTLNVSHMDTRLFYKISNRQSMHFPAETEAK